MSDPAAGTTRPLSAAEIRDQLGAMGITGGDTLLVHSSLRSAGPVEGRAEGLLDAFVDHLGREGLLVFPTLTYAHVTPEKPVFSVLDTPGCVGALSEIFRKRAGTVRSWHPTHSLGACGREASGFTQGHELTGTPCGRTSPWGRLPGRKARILFMGVGLECNTTMHGVEEWAAVPGRLTAKPVLFKVKAPGGETLDVPTRLHADRPSVHYAKLEGLFLKEGVMRRGRLGLASCSVLDVDAMTRLVMLLLGKDLMLFSHDRVPETLQA